MLTCILFPSKKVPPMSVPTHMVKQKEKDGVVTRTVFENSTRKKKRKRDKTRHRFLTKEEVIQNHQCVKKTEYNRDGSYKVTENIAGTSNVRITDVNADGHETRVTTYSTKLHRPVGMQRTFYADGRSKEFYNYDNTDQRIRVGYFIAWAKNGTVTEHARYDEKGSGKFVGPRVLRAANDGHVYRIDDHSQEGVLQHSYNFNRDGTLRLEKIYDEADKKAVQSNVRRSDGSVASMRGDIIDDRRFDFIYPDGVCRSFDQNNTETTEYYSSFKEVGKEIYLLKCTLRDPMALFRDNKTVFDPAAFRATTVKDVLNHVQKSVPGYKNALV